MWMVFTVWLRNRLLLKRMSTHTGNRWINVIMTLLIIFSLVQRYFNNSFCFIYRTLLYEIFLGRHPFKGVEAQTLIWRVSRGHVSKVDATDFPLVFKVSLFFMKINWCYIQNINAKYHKNRIIWQWSDVRKYIFQTGLLTQWPDSKIFRIMI